MFLTFNAEIKEGKKITVSNNIASVNSSFLFVKKPIEESQIVIKNNKITFNGKSEFIIDKTNSEIYPNMENVDFPRNIELKDNEVELFVDLNNKLNYVNKNEEKFNLTQGVIEK